MNEWMDLDDTYTYDWYWWDVKVDPRSRSQGQRSRSHMHLCENIVSAINHERMDGFWWNFVWELVIPRGLAQALFEFPRGWRMLTSTPPIFFPLKILCLRDIYIYKTLHGSKEDTLLSVIGVVSKVSTGKQGQGSRNKEGLTPQFWFLA